MLDLEEANRSLDLAYEKVEEMEIELERARGRSQNVTDESAPSREAAGSDDRTRTRERNATDRTDYWSNRSGRSQSRRRSPSRGKGYGKREGKQAEWRDLRDVRDSRPRGQSKDRRRDDRDERREPQKIDLQSYNSTTHTHVRRDLLEMQQSQRREENQG